MRNATPRIIAPSLPPLENRVEVLIATARLQMPFLPGVDQFSDTLATVLVTFDPSEAARRSVRMLAASFIAGAPSILQAPAGAEVGRWLADSVQKLEVSSTSIVVALPEYSPEIERQLRAFLEEARRAGCHRLSLVVGVAETPADWARCGLDGFVLTDEEQRDSDAMQMFAALAAVMAPVLMCPLDADDFRCALGNAENPSQIVEATFRLNDARLEAASERDEGLLGRSDGVAVIPSRFLRLSAQCRLVDRVRDRIRFGAAITIVTRWGLTAEIGATKVVSVAILCLPPRTTPERTTPS